METPLSQPQTEVGQKTENLSIEVPTVKISDTSSHENEKDPVLESSLTVVECPMIEITSTISEQDVTEIKSNIPIADQEAAPINTPPTKVLTDLQDKTKTEDPPNVSTKKSSF